MFGRAGGNFGRMGLVAPSGHFAGASLDLNFVSSSGYPAAPSLLLSTTRASDAYSDDTAGNWSLFASGVPRITNKGLRVEEARTNSIRNNSMQGAVAGTPGTLPTNWTVLATGVTVNVVGTGTANGIDYIDLSFAGTTGATFGLISFDTTTAIAAVTAQVWAESLFVSITNTTNISSTQLIVGEKTAAGAFVQNDVSTIVPTATFARFSYVPTLSGGGTVGAVQPGLLFNWSSGVAVSFTLRIGWPQCELGAFATSPIRTTSAAATRAADDVTTTAIPAGLTALTLFAVGKPLCPVTTVGNQVPVQADDGTSNNRSIAYRNSTNAVTVAAVVAGGVAQTSPTAGAVWADGTRGKIASGYDATAVRLGFNGTVNSAGAPTLPSTPTTLRFGKTLGPPIGAMLIERGVVFPRLLSAAEIQALTT